MASASGSSSATSLSGGAPNSSLPSSTTSSSMQFDTIDYKKLEFFVKELKLIQGEFDGTRASEYMSRFEACADSYRANSCEKTKALIMCSSEAIAKRLTTLEGWRGALWITFRNAVIREFAAKDIQYSPRMITKLKQRPGQSLADFKVEFAELIRLIGEVSSVRFPEKDLVGFFIQALLPHFQDQFRSLSVGMPSSIAAVYDLVDKRTQFDAEMSNDQVELFGQSHRDMSTDLPKVLENKIDDLVGKLSHPLKEKEIIYVHDESSNDHEMNHLGEMFKKMSIHLQEAILDKDQLNGFRNGRRLSDLGITVKQKEMVRALGELSSHRENQSVATPQVASRGEDGNRNRDFGNRGPMRCVYCNDVGHGIRNCEKVTEDERKGWVRWIGGKLCDRDSRELSMANSFGMGLRGKYFGRELERERNEPGAREAVVHWYTGVDADEPDDYQVEIDAFKRKEREVVDAVEIPVKKQKIVDKEKERAEDEKKAKEKVGVRVDGSREQREGRNERIWKEKKMEMLGTENLEVLKRKADCDLERMKKEPIRPGFDTTVGDFESYQILLQKELERRKRNADLQERKKGRMQVDKFDWVEDDYDDERDEECVVRSMDVSDSKLFKDRDYYAIPSGQVVAEIGNWSGNVVLDHGAESNIIGFQTWLCSRVHLRPATWNMRGPNGDVDPMLGSVIADVKIGDVTIKDVLFFVTREETHFAALLGRPFERRSRLKLDNRNDGSCWIQIQDSDSDKEFKFKAYDPNDPRNVTRLNPCHHASDVQFYSSIVEEKIFRRPAELAKRDRGLWRVICEEEAEEDHEKRLNDLVTSVMFYSSEIKEREDENEVEEKGVIDIRTKFKVVGQKAVGLSVNIPDPSFKPVVRPEDVKLPEMPCHRLTEERIANLKFGSLNVAEQEFLVKELMTVQHALTFEESERGCVLPSVYPPVKIQTIPHTPWAFPPLRLPEPILIEFIAFLKEKLETGVFELSRAPYAAVMFPARKKTGKLRAIEEMTPLNQNSVRMLTVPPIPSEISEFFAGYPILTNLDLYSGYDQIMLDVDSRDLTSVRTPIGHLRMTRLPQGWTNSVAVFQDCITKVLFSEIPTYTRPYLDDITVKPKSRDYDGSMDEEGRRRYVVEHVRDVIRVLRELGDAGMTVGAMKCEFGMEEAEVLGFLVSKEGRRIHPKKIQKVQDWPMPANKTELRGFLSLCSQYRIWIEKFAFITGKLYGKLKNDKEWQWDEKDSLKVMELREIIANAPILSPPVAKDGEQLVVSVDGSAIGVGAILHVEDKVTLLKKPSLFFSRRWKGAEGRYHSTKLEVKAIMVALHEFRYYLFGRQFIVETDNQSAIALLKSCSVLPDNLLSRWIAFVKLFDFQMRYVRGLKNGGPDYLSRIKEGASGEEDDVIEEDIDKSIGVYQIGVVSDEELEYLEIGRFLSSMEIPDRFNTPNKRRAFKEKALQYEVIEGMLFRKSTIGIPRKVIAKRDEKLKVMEEAHEELAHMGREGMLALLRKRFYWKGMDQDVREYLETCDTCQRRSYAQKIEPLHLVYPKSIFSVIGLDVVHMPKAGGFKYYVDARDYHSLWMEFQCLRKATGENVAKFLEDQVFLRHGVVQLVVTDRGECGSEAVRDMCRKYGARLVSTTAFHPEGNAVVERGHRNVGNAIAKVMRDTNKSWVELIKYVVWADRIMVRKSTGYSPFELVYGRYPVTKLDTELETFYYQFEEWKSEGMKTEDVIANRAEQLMLNEDRRESVMENVLRFRKEVLEAFNKRNQHRIRGEQNKFQVGDLVLVQDTSLRSQWSSKMEMFYKGPYVIGEIRENGTYKVKELDGAELHNVIHGNRLKIYRVREEQKQKEMEKECHPGTVATQEKGEL